VVEDGEIMIGTEKIETVVQEEKWDELLENPNSPRDRADHVPWTLENLKQAMGEQGIRRSRPASSPPGPGSGLPLSAGAPPRGPGQTVTPLGSARGSN
jgi:hypothetical protein